jgi:hypothetical protein
MKTSSLYLSFLFGAFLISFVFIQPGRAQTPEVPNARLPRTDDKNDRESRSFQEMVTKQQISRRKKEHDEMLKQGAEALRISQELETSFDDDGSLSDQDLQKLQELEKIVSKIRSELGGNDDDDEVPETSADSSENFARRSFVAAFKFLRTSTIKLFDELKRSTRFSISVAAIQASNSVIKFARFLRLKK